MSGDASMAALAAFIRARTNEIVASWAARATGLRGAEGLGSAALIDHLPPLLARVADIVDGTGSGEDVPAPRDLAEAHATMRLAQGFPIGEIVREHALLRCAIVDLLDREGEVPSLGALRVLDEALDDVVAGSVAAYAAARDRWLQSLDRIGAAALESLSLDDLLRRLLEAFVETTSAADTASILLVEDGELCLRASVGFRGEVAGFSLPIGEGFSGRIAATRAPLQVEDAAHDPLVRPECPRRDVVRALYGVPLIEEGELLGVACMGSLTTFGFTRPDQQIFGAMAARAAGAIHRAMLHEAAELRARQQRAVADFGWHALQAARLDEVFEDAVETISATLDVEMAKVLELDQFEHTLLLRAGVGFGPGVVGTVRVDAGPGSQAGYTLAARCPVIVDDLRSETRFAGARVLLDHGAVSGITVVIRAHGAKERAFGVLGVHTRRHRTFTADDVAFLESMANIISATIERAEDEHRVRQAEERFRLIVEQVQDYSMVLLDSSGRVESWTAGAVRMTGWEESEALGRHIATFYPVEDVRAGRPGRFFAEARTVGHAEDEGWRIRKDGSRFWANVTLTRLTCDEGEIRGFAMVTRDLTDRRRAEGRHHFLADASRRLAESLDVDATLRSIAQLCIERLSDWCAIDLLNDDGTLRRVTIRASRPHEEEAGPRAGGALSDGAPQEHFASGVSHRGGRVDPRDDGRDSARVRIR